MMQLNNTISASITAIGGYVPEERLTNKELTECEFACKVENCVENN